MPIERLIFIIVLAIAAAAVTVAVALALVGQVQTPPMVGLAVLSLIALCASFAFRRYTDSRGDKNAGE
jgi:membrane protein implicated in regulation of membrane protease activity